MASHHEIADLLENIRTELPERVRDAYEEAVQRATKEGRKRGRHAARRMMQRNPFLRHEWERQQREEGALAFFMLLVGLIGGAALMYLFDPDRGEQRRAALRAQANQAAADLTNAVEQASQRATEQVNDAADTIRDAPDGI